MSAKFPLPLLWLIILVGCQTQPTSHKQLSYENLFSPTDTAREIYHSPTLSITLGDPSYFTKPQANFVAQCVTQTWHDLEQLQGIPLPHQPWLILWHHPHSPQGLALLKNTRRDPPMRGITLYKPKRIIVLVGNPTPFSQARWQQIIRHEAVHASLFSYNPTLITNQPWWLNEGVAMLWETPSNHEQPALNPWRQPMLQYLFRSGQGLAISRLLAFNAKATRQQTLAKNYARAWGLTYYLYHQQPDLLQQYLAGQRQPLAKDFTASPSPWLKAALHLK